MESVNLYLFSKYRPHVMGMAIIMIMLYHVKMDEDSFPLLASFKANLDLGVDMFLLVSGIGLWYSFTKNPSVLVFYSRRLLRIMPAWLIVASVYYIYMYEARGLYSSNVWELLGNISFNLCFWRDCIGMYWFIPAIMVMYFLAPWYMKLMNEYGSRKVFYIIVPILLLFNFLFPILLSHVCLGGLVVFAYRLPIFFIGLHIGQLVKSKTILKRKSVSWALVILVVSLAVNIIVDYYQLNAGYLHVFLYIPMSLSSILCLVFLFEKLNESRCCYFLPVLSFLGGISLELYLLHENIVYFHLGALPFHINGYWPSAIISIILAVILGWLFHAIIQFLLIKIWR